MTKRVIVPIGFEMADQPTIRIANALAQRLGGDVEFVTVCPAKRVGSAERHLASVADGHSPTASWRVIEGDDVEDSLVGEALSHPDAIVCLSSLARRSVAESMWGSVSEQLVRDTGVPLILVGPHATRLIGSGAGDVLLVPLDGTMVGEAILADAFKIAAQLCLHVRLVQVVDPGDPGDAPADVRTFETTYLHNVAKEWHEDIATIDYDVLHGRNVGRSLSDYIDAHDEVVLVAMATRGIPVSGRLFYPSTTFTLLRRAAAPILILHPVPAATDAPTASVRPSMVVVGIDDLESSRPALLYAAEEANRRNVPLRIVHAWFDPIATSGHLPVVPLSIRDQAEKAELDAVGAAVDAVLHLYPNLDGDTVVACDSAARLIATSAADAELVVVGRHRSSRLVDALLGSTSEGVAHRVTCPVVSVPCPR
jgi:nucleotide-binding universal stress UspA family protein